MAATARSLRHDLTRTLLVWSGAFFAILTLVFALSFNDLTSYVLRFMADHRLAYQVEEFAKHMQAGEWLAIREESDALVQSPEVAAILLIDASGSLVHVSLRPQEPPKLNLGQPMDTKNLSRIVSSDGRLRLFERPISGYNATLALIMDKRPVELTIIASALWSMLLLLALLALSVLALHRALRRRLIEPVVRVRSLIGAGKDLPEEAVVELEASLPEEATDILHTYESLHHAHEEMNAWVARSLDLLPGCVWSADAHLSYEHVSPQAAEVLGVQHVKLIGRPLWSWLDDSMRISHHRQRLEQAVAAKRTRLELTYSIGGDGAPARWLNEDLCIHYDGDGRPSGIYGISKDITQPKRERQLLDEQLYQAQKMEAVGTLVGGIAHEFNNMLAGIVSNIFLLKAGVKEDAKQIKRLERIEDLTQRASGIINQLLGFARKGQMSVRRLELKPVLQETFALARMSIPENVDLDMDIQAEPAIQADAAQLQEAVMHLLTNAFDAVAEVADPRIRLVLAELEADEPFCQRHPHLASSHLARISVSDNGTGIAAENLDKVFEPFFTTKPVGKGTGLGLSTVYGFATTLGGAVEIDSRPQRGTSVHLYLPVVSFPAEMVTEDSGEILRGKGETILLADDEPVVRQAAREVLTAIGYKVVEAEDGRQAVKTFHDYKDEVDLVMLDLVMPNMGGTEAAGQIRKLCPDMPVLFITGYDMDATRERGGGIAHADLVHKPFQVTLLSQSVRLLLTRRHMKEST